jgi:hypothetical protein
MSRPILGILTCCCVIGVSPARAQVPVYDSGGFEGPRFTPGTLTGQDAVLGPWQQSLPTGGTSSATVQTTTVLGGTQAVQVNRAANSEGFWFVPKLSTAPQQVNVSWDMRVTHSVGPQQFGPFFGVDSYGSSGTSNRLGMLGVDATTGEILFLDGLNGLQVTTLGSPTVTFDAWHNFRMQLDYNGTGGGTYSVFVDNVLRQAGTPFFNNVGTFNFTDAPIAALAAAGAPADQAATGTAFFDNYTITATPVPEPSTIALAGVAFAGLVYRRWRSARTCS